MRMTRSWFFIKKFVRLRFYVAFEKIQRTNKISRPPWSVTTLSKTKNLNMSRDWMQVRWRIVSFLSKMKNSWYLRLLLLLQKIFKNWFWSFGGEKRLFFLMCVRHVMERYDQTALSLKLLLMLSRKWMQVRCICVREVVWLRICRWNFFLCFFKKLNASSMYLWNRHFLLNFT